MKKFDLIYMSEHPSDKQIKTLADSLALALKQMIDEIDNNNSSD